MTSPRWEVTSPRPEVIPWPPKSPPCTRDFNSPRSEVTSPLPEVISLRSDLTFVASEVASLHPRSELQTLVVPGTPDIDIVGARDGTSQSDLTSRFVFL